MSVEYISVYTIGYIPTGVMHEHGLNQEVLIDVQEHEEECDCCSEYLSFISNYIDIMKTAYLYINTILARVNILP